MFRDFYSLIHRPDESGKAILDLPEYVKTASHAKITGRDHPESADRPDLYAYPSRKLFPIGSKPATWVSALFYYSQNPEGGDVIEDRLVKAAKFFGILGDVYRIKMAFSKDKEPPEDSDDDYAITVQTSQGKKRFFPIRNHQELQKASQYLKQYREVLGFDDRMALAKHILKKAAFLGVELPLEEWIWLEKQAGQGSCSSQTAAELLFSRAKVLRLFNLAPDSQLLLAKTAMHILQNPHEAKIPSVLHKIARSVEKIDRKFGLKSGVGGAVPSIETLFTVTVKTASQAVNDFVELTDGKIFRKDDLRLLPVSELRQVLGDDFLEMVSEDGLRVSPEKLAEVVRTLPKPDAALFSKVLESHYIKPLTKLASTEQLLGQEGLRKLADLYEASASQRAQSLGSERKSGLPQAKNLGLDKAAALPPITPPMGRPGLTGPLAGRLPPPPPSAANQLAMGAPSPTLPAPPPPPPSGGGAPPASPPASGGATPSMPGGGGPSGQGQQPPVSPPPPPDKPTGEFDTRGHPIQELLRLIRLRKRPGENPDLPSDVLPSDDEDDSISAVEESSTADRPGESIRKIHLSKT